MEPSYHHTQTGWVGIVLAPAILIASVIIWSLTPEFWVAAALGLAAPIVLVLIHKQTVEIGDGFLSVRLGTGLIRKRFDLSEIRSVRASRVPWYAGWGVHQTHRGWVFSVAGFDAVEVATADGRRFLIGTDEPDELARALQRSIGARKGRG
ncbi:MAG: hypothetical protein ABIH26_13175 [Candidatus Eisenbacteria bacterium]